MSKFEELSAGSPVKEFVVQTLQIGGQTIHTATRQGNPYLVPLLYFNGIGAQLELAMPFVQTLNPEQTVILFDVPGIGGSSTPSLPYRFGCIASLVTQMLDLLGHGQVDAIGLSWGGFLAQQFAYNHPTRCRKLILAATTCGVASVPPSLRVMALMSSPRRYMDPGYAEKIAPEIYGGAFRHDKALCAAHAAKMQSKGGVGYYFQLGALWGWTSLTWLHRIKQPTMLLAGADDPLVPLVNMQFLAKRMPNAKLHVFDDGHLLLLTQTATIAPLLLDFLS